MSILVTGSSRFYRSKSGETLLVEGYRDYRWPTWEKAEIIFKDF